MSMKIIASIVALVLVGGAYCAATTTVAQSTTKASSPTTKASSPTTKASSPTTKIPSSTTKPTITTTENSNTTCAQYSECDDCVSKSKGTCVWCTSNKVCTKIGLLDLGKVCDGGLMETSWATCTVNMMALIIGMSVVGGVLLISVCCCICCCCCCKNSAKQKLKWVRQDALASRRSEDRKAKYAERRAERQAKNDEIRKKYGLFKDGSGSYQRFDNDNEA